MVDANTAAQDWVNGLSAKTEKAKAGAQRVTVAPGQAAARQKGAYVTGVTTNADKWANNVGKVTLAQWQDDFINKGIPRMASGAQQAQSKMAQFFTEFLPFLDSARSSLPARGTFEQNKARMNAMVDKVHAFRRRS